MSRLLPRMAVRVSRTVAFVVLIALCSGCGLTFHRDWVAAKNAPVSDDPLAGLWEGTWASDADGHNGKLRAIITKCPDGHYHARYCATFALVIPFAYETTHSATRRDGVTYFSGEQDLGMLAGGLYRYNGHADGHNFIADFHADNDYGVFRMQRVGAGGCRCGEPCACCGGMVGE